MIRSNIRNTSLVSHCPQNEIQILNMTNKFQQDPVPTCFKFHFPPLPPSLALCPPAIQNLPCPLRPPGPFSCRCSFLCLEWPLPTLSNKNTHTTTPCHLDNLHSHLLNTLAWIRVPARSFITLSSYTYQLEAQWSVTACPSDSSFPPLTPTAYKIFKGRELILLLYPQSLVGA